jgi:type II secretory ATPase GspE/PulE/Tfp pilus assembly ATPase PilB-like protein
MEEQHSAVRSLFERYKTSFDTSNILSPLSDKLDITGLWNKIINETHISSDALCDRIASMAGITSHHGHLNPPDSAVKKIPSKTQIRFHIALAEVKNQTAIIATPNPLDSELHDAMTFIFGSRYSLVVASPSAINQAIERLNQRSESATNMSNGICLDELSGVKLKEGDIPGFAKMLMRKSVLQGASDMHLQPFLDGYVVRIRVDGVLKRLTLISSTMADAVIRHIKAQSAMDTTSRMLPQDGRVLVALEGREYDLRISTLPVAGNQEKLVIRFLNRQSIYALSDIGFSLDEVHTVQRLAAKPSGVILVCGPTGSGKTTTLYSILNTLNDESISIMTVENPVEYRMQGLSQTEVNEKAGMTFARALRAILRQDPDVLLIGEIRDEETAQIAMQSALTGHLVLSTLHTNDSLSAIPRLLDLGINPIVLAESLARIMSQRLLRKLCEYCKQDTKIPSASAQAFNDVTHVAQACEPVGCEHCDFSGYKGRTVVAELVEINQAQRELLLGGQQDIDKFKAAMRGTFNSMSMSASRLIISGITTAAEASRVIGHQFWYALADGYKSELPDLSALSEENTQKTASKNAVLIAGVRNSASQALEDALSHSWLQVFKTDDASETSATLHANENIDFLILELDENFSDEQVIKEVELYRRECAWARIPALIRFPANKPHWEPLLKEHGATSRFVSYTIAPRDVVSIVQTAISDKLDFRWGIR